MPFHRRPKDLASCYEFNVLFFAPGVHPAGVRARLGFRDGVLTVEGHGVWLTVLADQVELRPGGFDGRQWMLSWETGNGTASALLRGEADLQQMQRLAPPGLSAQIERGLKRSGGLQRRFRWLLVALAALVLLPLLLLGLFWTNAERIAGWAAGHVDVRQEMQLGDLAFAQLRPGLRLVGHGPAVAMVREVGGRLTRGSAYRYQWHVADSPEINAFALPGGHVVVYTGLLRAADSAEEVAGVLAHEVQHVERRHALKNMIHGLGWRAVLSIALGDLSGTVWGDMAHRLGSLKYGRDLEREADLAGLDALRRARIAPDGLVRFLGKLARQDGAAIGLLSTHPAGAERLDALHQAIARQGGYAYARLPYDWSRIEAAQPR